MKPPRMSVVMPTYQRRDVVQASIKSLAAQEFEDQFDVVVVVDGSTDGSAAALRALSVPFRLTILEQPNEGASSARNKGAACACGDIILFMDDDMEAHPRLLAEHCHSHREGADVVLGHLPLHPNAPKNLLSIGVKQWADRRLIRLVSGMESQLTLHDLLTGQISVRRDVFHAVGGFSSAFTWGGSFGNEDIDFGYRLIRSGYKVVFNPGAVTWQNYVVGPRHFLRQMRQAGQADVIFARRYPEHGQTLFDLNGATKRVSRLLWRPLVATPWLTAPLTAGLRALALTLFRWGAGYGRISRYIAAIFHHAQRIEYWRGVREAGGIPAQYPVRVLCYHAVQDLKEEPGIHEYGIPADLFQQQIAMLLQQGYHFISADEFLRYVRGRGHLPSNPVLLTFDDGFASVLAATPTLREHRIPGVVFVVSGCIGGTNVWDTGVTRAPLKLLDLAQLGQLSATGIEIGGHSRSHPNLTQLSDVRLSGEVHGSMADLERAGFRARLFAYPYGEQDERVRAAMLEAGVEAAFTVAAGVVTSGDDPYQLRRIEVLRSDTGARLLRKVRTAGADAGSLRKRLRRVSLSLRRYPKHAAPIP